jgi:hypothetical protein
MLILSFVVAIIGEIAYRWMTRGERGSGGQEAMTSIAGM